MTGEQDRPSAAGVGEVAWTGLERHQRAQEGHRRGVEGRGHNLQRRAPGTGTIGCLADPEGTTGRPGRSER